MYHMVYSSPGGLAGQHKPDEKTLVVFVEQRFAGCEVAFGTHITVEDGLEIIGEKLYGVFSW